MADTEMTEFLSGVVGVVEANSFERLCLWQEHHTRRLWLDRNDGLLETVGHLDGMPVCLSLLTSKIDGHKVLFIDATSQVVDHRMIDKWLAETLPKTAFKNGGEYVNKTDAMNFHNVFPRRMPAAERGTT